MSLPEFMSQSGASWNLKLAAVQLLLSIGYLLLAAIARKLSGNFISVRRMLSFLLGMGLFYISWGSPLYFLAHVFFSLHMVQMSLLYFFAPPLLILGFSAEMLEWLWRYVPFHRAWRMLAHPAAVLALFNGLFILYHVPPVMDTVMTNEGLHIGYHVILQIASLSVWWPVVSPVLSGRLQSRGRKRFVHANSMILMPACILLMFPFVHYDVFTNSYFQLKAIGLCFPQTVSLDSLLKFRPWSPAMDQGIGGAAMIILHKFSYMAAERMVLTGTEQTRGRSLMEVV
ncbi:cytochrome c oxidase assembly protein [Ferviditalea candida]|uniref:Cytochrome c oxidase assembly protein n=1 Tax=Ferviditalea candida TaxID=3108399 RepID=A0ABU5ZLS0_9BACL|nr:cytochrome c oxidase assembly protein [Paenibacillaceae bacterium T2]